MADLTPRRRGNKFRDPPITPGPSFVRSFLDLNVRAPASFAAPPVLPLARLLEIDDSAPAAPFFFLFSPFFHPSRSARNETAAREWLRLPGAEFYAAHPPLLLPHVHRLFLADAKTTISSRSTVKSFVHGSRDPRIFGQMSATGTVSDFVRHSAAGNVSDKNFKCFYLRQHETRLR